MIEIFRAAGLAMLQLFANHVNVTTDSSSGNNLSPTMKTFYDMTLIDCAEPNLVHDQFGQKKPIPKGSGKKVEFRKFSALPKAMTPLTEGVTPDGQKLDMSKIEAEVRQYGDYISQSDMLEMTALDNTILEATKILGSQAGRTLDAITRNHIQAGSNVNYCSKWSGTTETTVSTRFAMDETSTLKVKDIQKVVAKLQANNAPTFDGDYICILHPYAAFDLKRDPEWIDSHKYAAPENLYTGEIGKVAGVRFVESSEAYVFRAPDLASNSRTLTINHADGYTGAITTVAFDGGTVVEDALIGSYISINGVGAKVTDNTTTSITFASTNFGTVADNTVIYPEGDKEGHSVYCSIIFGQGAYGVTELEGGGLETIVQQLGSAGTADPLKQRSTVGWKAVKTAELLIPEYLVRLESTSKTFQDTADNFE